jgi:hypothetical protein
MLFAHAWLRVQNQSQFAANQAPPEIVDAIEISDQFCMLHTHVPQPVLAWHMMITQGASGPEKPIHYDLSALQLGPAGSVIQGPVWGEDLKDFRSTGWLFVGAFDALRECSADNVVRVDVSAHDVDGAALKNVSNSDDSVSSSSASIPQGATTLQEALHVDCGSLAAFIGQAAPGVPSAIGPDQIVMETREDDLVLLRPDMAWRANYSMWARATVVYR